MFAKCSNCKQDFFTQIYVTVADPVGSLGGTNGGGVDKNIFRYCSGITSVSCNLNSGTLKSCGNVTCQIQKV